MNLEKPDRPDLPTDRTNLTVRPYRPGDEEGILATFNLVFREVCGPTYVDRTMAHWRWQYQQNPMGHRIWLAVAPDGTIVSQYAGVPALADTPCGERRFVQSVDSMTHPGYRAGLKRPGVFVITCWPWTEHVRRIGDAVGYGFPVDAAWRIGKRYLEYHLLRDIDYLIRGVSLPPIDAPKGLTIERANGIPPDVGVLYGSMLTDKRLIVRRDHRYLHWRYVLNPAAAEYELWTARAGGVLRGLLVLKPGGGPVPDHAAIAEFLGAERDPAATDALLHAATRSTSAAGRKGLVAVFPDWAPEWRDFEARGFVKTPSANWLQRRLVYLRFTPPLTEQQVQDLWWYTLGDSDLV